MSSPPADDPVGALLAEVEALEASARRLRSTLDVDRLSPVAAQELVPRLAVVERQLAAAGALCAARAAASVRRAGRDREAAEWLARHTGRTCREAERTLATAERTRDASGTRAAWLRLACLVLPGLLLLFQPAFQQRLLPGRPGLRAGIGDGEGWDRPRPHGA